jgi:Ser/Thr protein kinase RdoA (MazF antagonist)
MSEWEDVALFRWVEGRRRKASLTPNALASGGRFTARLHEHAAHFVPSVGHAARHWDWEREFGKGSPVAPSSRDPRFSQEQRAMLQAISHRVRMAMQELGTGERVWGLVHGDLHSSNYLFRGAEVGAIDFEDCGWGYYLYDLAVILDEIYAVFPAQEAAFRAGLLHGYRQIRELSVEHEALLDVFVAMRLAELLRWHALSKDPAHRPAVPQLLGEIEHHMPRLELTSG